MNQTPWTAADFERVVGRVPEQDDLERVNCQDIGSWGHRLCGVCKHLVPRALCLSCIPLTFC